MTNLEKFMAANASDKRVIAFNKLLNDPKAFNSLSAAGRMGRLMGELMREADEAFA